ncbi:MAG: aminotransferase class I/II-fold pyridoxal phosphate-dependent enzyme [Actinomycetota bacterium]
MERIYLSPPDMSATERSHLLAAFDDNWVAPVGPQLSAFETAFAARHGARHGVAVTSGSAGIHLALLLAGVEPGDIVVVPTFTFAATANAATYCGAVPVFVDSEPRTWNLDPDLVRAAIDDAHRRGERVGAVITVDLYGQCADHEPIRALCDQHGIPLIEDAAEAVGASWEGSPAGTFGDFGVFSFNGNKLMTTGGGGMLVTDDAAHAERARYLATQARQPVLHYEHTDIGFNYRLSNPLAAIGLGQLERLDHLLARRAANRHSYEDGLGDLPGVGFNPIDPRGVPNHWLTVLVLGDDARATPTDVIAALDAVHAEARPAWKPMHQQPVFAEHRVFDRGVAADAFARGVCLPSGSAMTEADLDRVLTAVRGVLA